MKIQFYIFCESAVCWIFKFSVEFNKNSSTEKSNFAVSTRTMKGFVVNFIKICVASDDEINPILINFSQTSTKHLLRETTNDNVFRFPKTDFPGENIAKAKAETLDNHFKSNSDSEYENTAFRIIRTDSGLGMTNILLISKEGQGRPKKTN